MDGPMNIEVLQATILEIRKFEKYETNWDGRGSIKPNFNSIDSAIYFVTKLFSYFAEKNIKWNSPHVSADEDGVITFEWWAPYINATSNDKLTVYFEQDRADTGTHQDFAGFIARTLSYKPTAKSINYLTKIKQPNR